MSGVELLLHSAIDYERTHQVVLYTLFEKSGLPDILGGVRRTRPTEWEPAKQLFDLGLSADTSRLLIEIKMWSSLTEQQLKRQTAFLKDHGYRGAYVLLGTSWFEYDDAKVREGTEGLGKKLGYEELLDALNRLLVAPNQESDVYELALAYRNALALQFETLKGAATPGQQKGRLFYYSLFWQLKQKLLDFKTAIYTVTNPGGPVFILNNQDWHKLDLHGVETELYYEVVNDHLCIKFCAETKEATVRLQIRDEVRRALHSVLDEQFKLIDAGRLGAYMTACQVEHDFSDVSAMDKSVAVFAGVGRAMDRVKKSMGL